MQTRDMTQGERSRFNGLQASVPMSHRYILVLDNARTGMNPITRSNRPGPLFTVGNGHSLGPDERTLVIDKVLMKVCLADSTTEKPTLPPIPRPYVSEY